MLKKILEILFAPLAILGALIQWLVGLATPAPVRQASARMHDAQAVKRLLDEAEAAEEPGPVAVPTTKPHSPVLPPAAAMAQAGHLILGSLEPDLSYLLPEVAAWIRGMSRDEALAIREMGDDEIADHIYARRTAPWLRPVVYRAPRRRDELDQVGYLDDLVAGFTPR